MMLSDRLYGGCLRSVFAFLLGSDETDLRAFFQLFETAIDHAVGMEIDLLAVGRLNKTVVGEQLGHIPRQRRFMKFDIAT